MVWQYYFLICREGSTQTPAHRWSDFKFKTYAPVAFRYFRELFKIRPDDFLVSVCTSRCLNRYFKWDLFVARKLFAVHGIQFLISWIYHFQFYVFTMFHVLDAPVDVSIVSHWLFLSSWATFLFCQPGTNWPFWLTFNFNDIPIKRWGSYQRCEEPLR